MTYAFELQTEYIPFKSPCLCDVMISDIVRIAQASTKIFAVELLWNEELFYVHLFILRLRILTILILTIRILTKNRHIDIQCLYHFLKLSPVDLRLSRSQTDIPVVLNEEFLNKSLLQFGPAVLYNL